MNVIILRLIVFILIVFLFSCASIPPPDSCEADLETECIEKKKKKNSEDDMERLDHKIYPALLQRHKKVYTPNKANEYP